MTKFYNFVICISRKYCLHSSKHFLELNSFIEMHLLALISISSMHLYLHQIPHRQHPLTLTISRKSTLYFHSIPSKACITCTEFPYQRSFSCTKLPHQHAFACIYRDAHVLCEVTAEQGFLPVISFQRFFFKWLSFKFLFISKVFLCFICILFVLF